jgi:hypothetical protein
MEMHSDLMESETTYLDISKSYLKGKRLFDDASFESRRRTRKTGEDARAPRPGYDPSPSATGVKGKALRR